MTTTTVSGTQGNLPPAGVTRIGLRAYLFAAGLGVFTLGTQVIVARELLATFSGTELVLAFFYAIWLASFGAGSWLTRRRGGSGTLLFASLALMALPQWSIAALRHAPGLLGLSAGETPPLWAALASPLIIAPWGIIAGMVFPLGARFVGEPQRLGRFYAAEALGGLASGAFISLWLLERAGSFQALAPLTACFALAVWAVARAASHGGIGFRLAFIGILLHSIVWSWQGNILDAVRWHATVGGGSLVWSGDSRYGHLTVGQFDERFSFYVDGTLAFSCPADPLELLEARTFLQLPGAIRAVGVANHPNPPLHAVLPPTATLYAVQEDALVGAAAARLCDAALGVAADPREWLRSVENTLDLLVVYAPEPLTAVANRYSTVDFFRVAAKALAPGGVLALSAHLPGALLSGTQATVASGTYQDLRSAFASVLASPGPGGWFFAGVDSSFSLAEVRGRAALRDDGGLSVAHVDLLFPPAETAALNEALSSLPALPSNTDRHPRAYLRQLQVWLERSGIPAASIRRPAGATPAVWVVIIAGALLWSWRSRRSAESGATGTIVTTGFVAFAGSMLVLLGFQHAVGTLYGRIALLNGLYMAGLAVGAWSGARYAIRLWVGDLFLIGVFSACAAVLPSMHHALAYYAASISIAVAAGWQFAAAAGVVERQGRAQRAAGLLEAADHAGATIGSIAGGLIILPLCGFGGGFLLLASVKLISAVSSLSARSTR
ncbi:hypothetical protein JXA88_10365 [Candidatus Fermentibacteria bacterium]|nr:hypothetical protein [Candidatus Fermentibacteria bacterium]